MRVLVYGAGVIGCYLTHVLCEAGNAVSLLARGTWKENLEKNGLVIYHHLQKKTTMDHPKIVAAPDTENGYDIVFAVMQYDQMMQILEPLSKIKTKRLVLVGNNMEAAAAEYYLREHGILHPKILCYCFLVSRYSCISFKCSMRGLSEWKGRKKWYLLLAAS